MNRKSIIDFLVFTIKELEAEALKKYGYAALSDKKDNLCLKGQVKNKNTGRVFEFIHYNMSEDSGLIPIGVAVTNALDCWDPLYVIVLGIAAGFERHDVGIGDILISSEVIHYSKGKQHDGGHFEYRPKPYPSSTRLGQFLKEAANYDWVKDEMIQCGTLEDYSPKVHFGPILSGDVVMDDAEWVEWAGTNSDFKDAIGLEMEAVGAHHAVCKSLESTKVITLRGVSDDGSNKGDEYQECAATAVAAFLLRFLRNTVFASHDTSGYLTPRSLKDKIQSKGLEMGEGVFEMLMAKFDIELDKVTNNILDVGKKRVGPSDLEGYFESSFELDEFRRKKRDTGTK